MKAQWCGISLILFFAANSAFGLDLNAVLIRSRIADRSGDFISALSTDMAGPVTLKFFDDAQFICQPTRIDVRAAERFTSSGFIIGEPGGWFVISVEDDALIAHVFSPGRGAFQAQPMPGSSRLRIDHLDSSQLGECACDPSHLIDPPAHHPPRRDIPQLAVPDGSSACDQLIDVLVAYTPAARNALGSDAAIRALAYASVAAFNIINDNSLVTAQVRLIHVAPVAYAETDNLTADLARLQSPADGFLDELHGLRQQYGADLVSLLVHSTSNSCGVAYVMQTASTAFSPFAFSVVQQNCAIANLSFPHELAHNLGCQHDWNDPGAGVFEYSHGHRFTGASGQLWRTVMATTPGVRIPHFSNPLVQFDGMPTGVTELQPQPADNARSINNVASIAAAFMPATFFDCNANGIADDCDIDLGTSLDLNENGVPDECDAPPCAAHVFQSLTADDAISFDNFGHSVSMSNDRAIAGAPFNDDAGPTSGSAYVFRRENGNWVQEAKLVAADAMPFHYFGYAVAISPGGEFAIVGAPRDGFAISDAGAAYIFQRSGTQWTQIAKFVNPDPQQADWFGWSVAWAGSESGEALYAVISSVFDDQTAGDAGAVYVYRYTGSGWNAPIKLNATDGQSADRLGYSVAGALAGDRIIAGAPQADHVLAPNAGAAYVFRRDGEQWIQEAKLTADGIFPEARLGWSVSIDGERAIAGAPRDSELGTRAGAAIVFTRDPSNIWSQQQKLTASNAGIDKQFGAAVALRGDFAVIGSILDSVSNTISGSIAIFHQEEGQWQQQALIAPENAAAYDNLGNSVAIAPNQQHAIAGAFLDDHHGEVDAGSASIFSLTISRPDCNGNGLDDACDIAAGLSADQNANGIPDECEPTCPEDVALHDGIVNVQDLLAVINAWGACPTPCPGALCTADINGDCTVNVQDLVQVIIHWGACK